MTSPAPDLSPAVRLEQVRRVFGSATALDEVNLDVLSGAFLLLVGANGAGKTTLLHLLLGLFAPSAGSVTVFGMAPMAQGAAVRARAGFVAESGEWPFPRQHLDRFLAFHAAYRDGWDHDYARRLSDALDLRLDRPVRALSKGEFRRAQLVAALAHRPDLLLLDEPTDGLDPVVRGRVLELLAAHLADSPATVIVSTHQVHEMEGLADHLAVVHKGRIEVSAPRAALDETIREVTFTRPPVWSLDDISGCRILRREHLGREERWIIEGPEASALESLRRAGAERPTVRALSLEGAAVALLEAAIRNDPVAA